MTKYLFNEEILRDDRRSGTYILKYIFISIVLFILSAGIWFYTSIPKIPEYVNLFFTKIIEFSVAHKFPVSENLHLQIIFSVALAVAGIIILICGMVGLVKPRLILTLRRVCLIKGKKNYREARFDKIETIRIKGRKIILYTADCKISFGPIYDAYGTRDAIVIVMTKCLDNDNSRQTRCSEPEPYTKSGDVFDGEKI